jgi:RNA polymerase sigma-70 factor (ECF subfamily)
MKPPALVNPARFLPERALPATAGAGNALSSLAMDRYSRGDDSAFADVYDAVAPRLHGYLLRQTRDGARADDLLQLTLLQMHRHRGSYLAGSPVLPWAFAIARRLLIDDLRHRKTDALSAARSIEEGDRPGSVAPEDEVASREVAALVEEVLDQIPEAQRTAFELLKVEGLSLVDAAQVLGVSVNAVKLRAFRAYSAIRTALDRAFRPPPREEESEKT